MSLVFSSLPLSDRRSEAGRLSGARTVRYRHGRHKGALVDERHRHHNRKPVCVTNGLCMRGYVHLFLHFFTSSSYDSGCRIASLSLLFIGAYAREVHFVPTFKLQRYVFSTKPANFSVLKFYFFFFLLSLDVKNMFYNIFFDTFFCF